jgi:hypothetical protein
MVMLKRLNHLTQVFPISQTHAEALARQQFFPEGVIVRLGRRVFVNPEKLEDFVKSGGKALAGGWRKEAL